MVVPLQARQAAQIASASGQIQPCATSDLCSCQSNEKQLGTALIEYYHDFDEKFPVGTQPRAAGAAGVSGVGWAGTVAVYGLTPANFKCPNDATAATAPAYPVSYALNSALPGLSQSVFTDPSVTVCLFEISGDPVQILARDEGASSGAQLYSAAGDGTDLHLYATHHAGLNTNVLYATGRIGSRPKSTGPASQEPFYSGRHSQGTNYLLADGHAHWYLPSDVSSGTNAANDSAPQQGYTHGAAAGFDAPPYQATFSIY